MKPTFDRENFIDLLSTAAAALADVLDHLELATEDEIAAPGKGYLQARLELAEAMVESELPGFKKAATLAVAGSLLDTEVHWRGEVVGACE